MPIQRGGRTLTNRERAAEIRRLTGWTQAEYNRRYDVLRNRARNYEAATGAERGSINVGDLLYRDVRSRAMAQRYGEQYRPSGLYEAVSAAPASSTGRRISKAGIARVSMAEQSRGIRQFSGILYNSKYSDQLLQLQQDLILSGSYDPIEFTKILEEYARQLGREKENIAAFNRNVRNPFDYINWHS